MKLSEFAKANKLTTAAVTAAAKQLGLRQLRGSDKLDGDAQSQLLTHFGIVDPEPAKEPATITSEVTEELATRFDGSPFLPTKLFKYARRRGLTLDQAIEGAIAAGMTDAHRHRDMDQEDIDRLDNWFKSHPPTE